MRADTVTGYRFEPFVLNIQRGCVQRAGVDLELRPKAFEVVRYLVEHAGELVGKQELVEFVWPDVIVSEDSLAQCVREIRRLLDDDGQKFIKTVPRRGYMFIAPVSPVIDGDLAPRDTAPADLPVAQARPYQRPILAVAGVSLAALLGFWTVGPLFPAPVPSLLGSNQTVLGQTITYPDGVSRITAEIVILPPGAESPWHTHPAPLFAYVLDGKVSVDYGSKGVREYGAGDGMLEAVDWPHKAANTGFLPARILVVHMGAEGLENRLILGDPDDQNTGPAQALASAGR